MGIQCIQDSFFICLTSIGKMLSMCQQWSLLLGVQRWTQHNLCLCGTCRLMRQGVEKTGKYNKLISSKSLCMSSLLYQIFMSIPYLRL